MAGVGLASSGSDCCHFALAKHLAKCRQGVSFFCRKPAYRHLLPITSGMQQMGFASQNNFNPGPRQGAFQEKGEGIHKPEHGVHFLRNRPPLSPPRLCIVPCRPRGDCLQNVRQSLTPVRQSLTPKGGIKWLVG